MLQQNKKPSYKIFSFRIQTKFKQLSIHDMRKNCTNVLIQNSLVNLETVKLIREGLCK